MKTAFHMDMITFILKFQLLLILQTLDATCPKGEYGFKCQFRCRCKQDIGCNPITGSCPNGCNPKFYGPGCLLFNPFTYDPHGRLYTGSINRTESGKPCQPWSLSIFVIFFNYTGSQFADKFIPGAVCRNPNNPSQNKTSPWCFTNRYTLQKEKCYLSEGECHDGRFGPNCVNECHCRNLEPCDKQTGKCRQCYDGWIGPSCQMKCAASKYGTNCEENCGKCKENLCDHETGKCLNGCNGGWIGDFCNTKCEVGKYETNCSDTCLKCKDNVCDPETGKCLNGCYAGWIGEYCNTECPDGRFGLNCLYECHCQNLETCDKRTGKCTYCYDGWIGKACQQKCEVGKYGTNCSETCLKCKKKLCDHETGQCLHGCNTGWEGYLCNTSYTNTSEKHSTFNWIISSVVVGIFMVIIIVLTIYCWLKRKGSSTTVSNVRPDIHTINNNIASDRAFLNNVQEAETILDGQSVKRVNHHSSSFRLSTSSDDSAHSSDSLTSI